MIAGLSGCPDPYQGGPIPEPAKSAAAQVVLVLCLLRPPESLTTDKIARVDLATTQQEANSVVVVAGGNDLIGAFEMSGGGTAFLRTGRRNRGASCGHLT